MSFRILYEFCFYSKHNLFFCEWYNSCGKWLWQPFYLIINGLKNFSPFIIITVIYF